VESAEARLLEAEEGSREAARRIASHVVVATIYVVIHSIPVGTTSNEVVHYYVVMQYVHVYMYLCSLLSPHLRAGGKCGGEAVGGRGGQP